MHLVNVYGRLGGVQLRCDVSAGVLHAQGECVCHALHEVVQVEFLFLEDCLLAVEHRHLQHLLHKEAQAFRLVIDYSAKVFHHHGALCHGLVVEHLRGEGYAADGCLELVGHVVDKVVLYFRVPFLAENHHYGEYERNQQHDGEHHRGYHEPYSAEDIAAHVGEMNLHHAHLV